MEAPRDSCSADWAPLCSHTSFREPIRGELKATAEELEVVAAIRAEQLLANANIRSQAYRARKRAKDEEAYKARVRDEKNAWNERNRGKESARSAANRERAIAEQKHHCHKCDEDFQSEGGLNLHYKTENHKRALVVKNKPGPEKGFKRAGTIFRQPAPVPGAYYEQSARPEALAAVSPKTREALIHVARIDETAEGEVASSKCDRCLEKGYTCKRYTAAVLKAAKYRVTKCARCKYDNKPCSL